jgi:hypothetical protein
MLEINDVVKIEAESVLGIVAKLYTDGEVGLKFPNGEYVLPVSKVTLVEKAPETISIHRRTTKHRPRNLKQPRLSVAHDGFLNALRPVCRVRVQLPEFAINQFMAQYQQVTGRQVEIPSEYVSVISTNNKWTYTLTLLFPPSILPLVPSWLTPRQESQDSETVYAINDKDFLWELLSRGFVLGEQN